MGVEILLSNAGAHTRNSNACIGRLGSCRSYSRLAAGQVTQHVLRRWEKKFNDPLPCRCAFNKELSATCTRSNRAILLQPKHSIRSKRPCKGRRPIAPCGSVSATYLANAAARENRFFAAPRLFRWEDSNARAR